MIDLPWDPEFDSPATLAIIGAGPVGIEAAIYARFLGYFVSIFDTRRVAHRMLDWHERPLTVPVSQCTSPLGHAAIKSQTPEYVVPSPDEMWTGKQYAENYLLPLAKTDLLFDDIHFLSPVVSVSKLKTHRFTDVDIQDRCEDEFRLVVEGRHRGTWVSRADIVLDCRGPNEETMGIGPGGGLAIGELGLRPEFYTFTPKHRKFEKIHLAGKRVCVVGNSDEACLFVQEYLEWHANAPESRLTWILSEDEFAAHPLQAKLLAQIEDDRTNMIQSYPCVGVDKVSKSEAGQFSLTLLLNDDTTVEMECDVVASFPERRETKCLGEVDSHELQIPDDPRWSFVTKEPGYYRLQCGGFHWDEGLQTYNAGAGIAQGLQQVRDVFRLIVERESLDLHQVMAENLASGRV